MKAMWKLFLCSLIPLLSYSHFQFDRIDYVLTLEREEDSLKIKKYIKLNTPDDRAFHTTYWKVYYDKNTIVGEELYSENKLVYYYIYYFTENKIYQKGFFWHGIRQDIKFFKAHGKNIKQGYFYKNYPDCYKVYNKEGKLLYFYQYQDFES